MIIPQFWFSSEFLKKEAKARNDPSFITTSHFSTTPKREGSSHFSNTKQSVTVHKTDFSAEAKSQTEKSVEDMSKLCPMHRKLHRTETSSLKKILLTLSCIHYSPGEKCEVDIKHLEFRSDRHLSTLHPSLLLQSASTFCPPKQHGKEEEDKDQPNVTTMST